MNYQTPSKDQLVEMLTMILGGDAQATPVDALKNNDLDYVANYIDADGNKVATCSCALPTGAALGCALSMIPAGGAEAMVEDGELSGTATDNLYEVMNILSSLLMNDKSAHLKLAEVVQDPAARLQGDGVEEVLFDIDLGGYGSAELAFNHT